MSALYFLMCLAIIVLCELYDCSGISINNYKKYTDVAPTGTAYNAVSLRSRLECSKSCSKDPKCSTFTSKEIGSVVECEMFECWDVTQNTTMTGVNTYTKEVTDPVVCPAGYSRVCDHCYHFLAGSRTWDVAMDYCTSTHPGAYLVEVDTVGENRFVQGRCVYWPWLGVRRLSGTFTWTHSGRNVSAGYENWAPARPAWTGDCIVMDFSTPGLWYDGSCDSYRYVVCEHGN